MILFMSIILLVLSFGTNSEPLQKESNTAHINAIVARLTSDSDSKLLEMINKLPKTNNTNWCCKIDLPDIFNDYTRQVSWQKINSEKQKCGVVPCGFLGIQRCSVYCTVYWTSVEYHIETFVVKEKQLCPKDQLICCKNFLYVLGHCLDIEELKKHTELLKELKKEGIVIPGLTSK